MMENLRQEHGYPVKRMCEVFEVSRSGFYAWQRREPTARQLEEGRLEVAIKAAHKRGRGTYGREKIQKELSEVDGITVGLHRIRRIRRKLGLYCIQKKKFKATTDSRHSLPVAPNLLNQDFSTISPGLVWVADITYILAGEGWLYLAGIKDLCTGEIVGHAMAARMTQDLVCQALFRAVVKKRPKAGLIHHSDRGSQYCSKRYQKLLKQFGMLASMSRKGNCYDNAPMENFFGSLKTELVHHRRYRTRQEATRDIIEYIEIFYNRQRRQTRLGFLSPAAYEKHLFRKQQVIRNQ
jgi:putative transposase